MVPTLCSFQHVLNLLGVDLLYSASAKFGSCFSARLFTKFVQDEIWIQGEWQASISTDDSVRLLPFWMSTVRITSVWLSSFVPDMVVSTNLYTQITHIILQV